MTLQDYRRALIGRWRLLVAGLLLGALAALLLSFLLPGRYTSEVAVLLTPTPAAAPGQGEALALARATSYVPLVTQDRVTAGVAGLVGGGLDARDVAGMLAVTAPDGTPLLLVTVTDSSPDRARAIGAATADALVGLVAQVESASARGGPPPVAASVVQPATFDAKPVSLARVVQVALGALVGLVAGAGWALARQVADHSVVTADELRRETRWPVLATLPPVPKAADASATAGMAAARVEAARKVRTGLECLAPGAGGRVLVLAGVQGGEGASTMAAALAPVMARAGRSVVAVDADFRRPRLAALLGAGAPVGLADVLSGARPLTDVLVRDGEDLLDVLPAGGEPGDAHAADLLASPRLAETVRTLSSTYDTVLVDVPAILPTAGGVHLAALADGVVVVAESGRTTSEDLVEVTEALRVAGASVVGAVLTGVAGSAVVRRRRPDEPSGSVGAAVSGATPEDLPAGSPDEQPVPSDVPDPTTAGAERPSADEASQAPPAAAPNRPTIAERSAGGPRPRPGPATTPEPDGENADPANTDHVAADAEETGDEPVTPAPREPAEGSATGHRTG